MIMHSKALVAQLEGKICALCSSLFRPLQKTKMSKGADPKALEELSFKSCPLGHEYDPDLHDAVAHFRILDGSLPEQASLGSSVKNLR